MSDTLEKELERYRKIGTVKECKEAVARRKPKKVKRQTDPLSAYYHEEECPHCGKELHVNVPGYRYTYAIGETNYCPYCGGAIDWSE